MELNTPTTTSTLSRDDAFLIVKCCYSEMRGQDRLIAARGSAVPSAPIWRERAIALARRLDSEYNLGLWDALLAGTTPPEVVRVPKVGLWTRLKRALG